MIIQFCAQQAVKEKVNENKENKDSLTILVSFLLWVRDRLNLLRIES